jgi:hypothetical protein
MPRPTNKIKTKPLKLSTTPKVGRYLEALVAKELYGKTGTEVAQRLLEERIRALIAEGTLKEETH